MPTQSLSYAVIFLPLLVVVNRFFSITGLFKIGIFAPFGRFSADCFFLCYYQGSYSYQNKLFRDIAHYVRFSAVSPAKPDSSVPMYPRIYTYPIYPKYPRANPGPLLYPLSGPPPSLGLYYYQTPFISQYSHPFTLSLNLLHCGLSYILPPFFV